MTRKEPADWVFFNVKFADSEHEAIAIYKNKVIDIGSIPHIFSNYRGFKDYNAQGFSIGTKESNSIKVGESAEGIAIFTEQLTEEFIIWQLQNGKCLSVHTDLLDPHWDDH